MDSCLIECFCFSTILVEPNCTAVITSGGDIEMTVYDVAPKKIGLQLDAIQLSIFSHRFMSIAEQMGRLATCQMNANKRPMLQFTRYTVIYQSSAAYIDFDEY